MTDWKIAQLEPPDKEGMYLVCDEYCTIKTAFYDVEEGRWFEDSEEYTEYHDVKFWQERPEMPNVRIPTKE